MPNIILNNPGFMGLADTKWSGIAGSFAKFVGLDIHSTPGTVTVQQRLVKHSGSVITSFCRERISVSDGARLWFSDTDGNIWRETGGTYTLVYTTSPAAGAAGCLGAAEYNGYIYWATQSRIHRTAVTDTAFASVSVNWATFTNTDAEFHPMLVQNQRLYIGDKNYVSKVDDLLQTTFVAKALDLLTPHRVKSLGRYEIDILVGTTIASTVNRATVVRWDGVQNQYTYLDTIEENAVNAFLEADNGTLLQAGIVGNWYEYNGAQAIPYKRIPGTWTPTQYGEVHPTAVAMFKGIPVFGFSNSPDAANSTGNPADQGIYSFGNYSKDYPRVMTGPDFIISENIVASIEIGGILCEGSDLYVAWKNGSTYGVDKLSYSLKYASAYLETLVISLDPLDFTVFDKLFSNYVSLPSGTTLTYKYKIQHAANYTTLVTKDDTLRNLFITNETESIDQARAVQFRIEFTVSDNNAPVLETIGCSYISQQNE